MTRKIRLFWNVVYGEFFVKDDKGGTKLPQVSAALLDDVETWKAYLRENFEPDNDHDIGGRWADGKRWWFADEARRLEREFRRQLPLSKGVVKVSPFPGIIQLRFLEDNGGWPLWSDYGATGPEDFPMLSQALREDLVAWADASSALPGDAPGGEQLTERTRTELGPAYEVTFWHPRSRPSP